MPTSKIASFSGWFIIVIATLFAILSAYGSYVYRTFERRVKELDAQGELVSLDELVHVVENELNDTNYYFRLISETNPPAFGDVVSIDDDGLIICDNESIEQLETFESDHPEFFKNLSLAASAADISMDINDSERSISILSIHSFTYLLAWKGFVHVEQGDETAACDVAIDLVKLAEKIERPFLLNLILGQAIRERAWEIMKALADRDLVKNIDSDRLATFFEWFDEKNYLKNFENALKAERSVATFNMLNTEKVGEIDTSEQSGIAWLASKFPAGPTIVAGNGYLDQMEIAIERGKKPFSKPVGGTVKNRHRNTLTYFGGDILMAMDSIREQIGYHTARSHVIRILLALHSNGEAANRDSWSAEYLQSLGVPASATIDPFTDKPIIVDRKDGQWLVYSFGSNRTDDGGRGDDIRTDLPIVSAEK